MDRLRRREMSWLVVELRMASVLGDVVRPVRRIVESDGQTRLRFTRTGGGKIIK
jgi:hypothetical protein